ncbi:MAG: hypothetical protein R8G66_15570 [Cytophagales bacterium]|nr:hypothetical protein [Cytophagales bacterium]
MSESIPRFIVLYALMVLSGCSGSNQNNDSSAVASEVPSEELKNVNDLTYMEVVELVFKDEGEGVEWHGEALPNELKEALLIEEGGPCGEHDCGKIVNIRNTSDKTIVAITRGDFDINEEQGYLARKYTIPAGQTRSMGCSHLCYRGEAFPFPRTIVGSAYSD